MNISSLYSIFLSCSEVTTDSRDCKDQSLFFALRGESFNGNAYAEKALTSGSAYVVVDDPFYYRANDTRYIWAENCLTTLQQLANHHRKQFDIPVLGITGTNGKTTTKELLAAVLSTHFSVLFTQGNLNNQIGVPLTLLRLKPQHQFAIIEMGASHKGDIKELVEIAEPTFGLITNIGKAHIEGFGSLEGVKSTKEELYTYIDQKKEGFIFRNADDEILQELSKNKNFGQFTYGSSAKENIMGRISTLNPYVSFEWKSQGRTDIQEVSTQLIGSYNLPNLLAAVSIGSYFNIPALAINKALSNYAPQNNRSQLQHTAYNTLIIDAYNANPTSMQASLQNFIDMASDNKVVILGEMGELGVIRKEEHQKVVELIKGTTFDDVFLVGKTYSEFNHPYSTYRNVEELVNQLEARPLKNKTILIKGSRSVHLEKAIPEL